MRVLLTTLFIFGCLSGFAQTPGERALLNLSAHIFSWEVVGKTDSLENVFHERLSVMTSSGVRQTRTQYIARLTGGGFIHNAIEIQESAATIDGNTGIVMGKGKFTVTSNGKQMILSLAYTEVFARSDNQQPWKLLAIHANPLPAASQ